MSKLKNTTSASLTTPLAEDFQSEATRRAFAALTKSLGREVTKLNRADLECRRAIGETFADVVAALDEDGRASIFFAFETAATSGNRRKIAKHTLRPAIVDEMLAEAQAQKAREEAKAPAESSGTNSDQD